MMAWPSMDVIAGPLCEFVVLLGLLMAALDGQLVAAAVAWLAGFALAALWIYRRLR